MAFEHTLLLERRYELRKDHLIYLQNSLAARFKSRDLRLREGIIEQTGQKAIIAYHADSLEHRFAIPVEKELGGKNPRYVLAPFFHAALSTNFRKGNLAREVEAALSLYTKYELD